MQWIHFKLLRVRDVENIFYSNYKSTGCNFFVGNNQLSIVLHSRNYPLVNHEKALLHYYTITTTNHFACNAPSVVDQTDPTSATWPFFRSLALQQKGERSNS
jgi:hypothetical protein